MVSTKVKLSMVYFNARNIQSSRSQVQKQLFLNFFKICVPKNLVIFTVKHLWFPVNIAKFLRTAFVIEHLQWVLLQVLYKKRFSEKFHRLHQNVSLSQSFLIKLQTQNLRLYENRVTVQVFCCEFCKISQNNIMQCNGCS